MILNFKSFLNENVEITSIKEEVRLMARQQKAVLCDYLLKKKIPVQAFDFSDYENSPVNYNKFTEEHIGTIGEILETPDIKQRAEDNYFRIKFSSLESNGGTVNRSFALGYPLDLLDRALVDDYNYTDFLRNFKTFYNSNRYGI
jgi:hypothetical protein